LGGDVTRTSLIAAMLVATLFGGATAAATPAKIAPPGNAGATQYEEDVPTAQGSQPVSTLLPGGGGQLRPLSAAVRRRLNEHGADGRAALAVAEETTPAQGQAKASGPLHSPASSGAPSSRDASETSQSSTGSGSPAATSGGSAATIPLSRESAGESSAATALAGSLGGSGGGLGVGLPILLGVSVAAAAIVIATQRRRRS
jgi:hypothetical protein